MIFMPNIRQRASGNRLEHKRKGSSDTGTFEVPPSLPFSHWLSPSLPILGIGGQSRGVPNRLKSIVRGGAETKVKL